MLKELFYNCLYIKYETAGHDVNYAFIEHKEEKKLYIYFQGSSSTTDWIRNFLFTKKVYKEFRVHRGFFNAYSEVRSIILDKIYENDYQEIVVVGYSHGGALCTLAVEDIAYHFPNINLQGFAFESPRCVGGVKKIQNRWKNLTLIRTNNDIVTHCPPKFVGYSDVGTMLKVKGDTSLVKEWYIPRCIKSHYPQVVYEALRNFERKK